MAQQTRATGPKYRRIADDLLARIRSGEYPPGSQLPTKAKLMERYQVAINTVERAIDELRQAGFVETAQGAGMFVREPAEPSEAAAEGPTERLDGLESEVATLRKEVRRLQAEVMDLYHSTGRPYPYGEEAADAGRQAG
jgi:DNA-binding GntR family transcriptional regulator